MKKSLTLAALVFGMIAFSQVCQAESTSLDKSELICAKGSFSFLSITIQAEVETTSSLFQLAMQKSADDTYLFTFHYSAEMARFVNQIMRFLFVVYILWLFKKNFPLLKLQHA